MFANVGDRQRDVGHQPAPRDGREDRREREEREQVALVDAGRDDEERHREDGDADQDREAVGPAGDDRADDGEDHQEQPVPTTTAGTARTRGRSSRTRALGGSGERRRSTRVRRPWPLPSCASSAHGLYRVDRQVGVAAGGRGDLPDEVGDREAERRRRQRGPTRPQRRGTTDERRSRARPVRSTGSCSAPAGGSRRDPPSRSAGGS